MTIDLKMPEEEGFLALAFFYSCFERIPHRFWLPKLIYIPIVGAYYCPFNPPGVAVGVVVGMTVGVGVGVADSARWLILST
jgi:hypothetical protein